MRLLNVLKPGHDSEPTVLDAAATESDGGVVGNLMQTLLKAAIDGRGPIPSTQERVRRLRARTTSTKAAVDATVRVSVLGAAAGGFVTSLGGFASMAVAIPVNVVEFYVQATRAVGTIAELRGYDVDDARIRTAIMLTLSGAQADDLLSRTGANVSGNLVVSTLQDQLPEPAVMMINKAVAFRLVRSMGERTLARLGKAVPVLGGVVGAGLDAYLMLQIVESAKYEFPERA